MAQTIRELTLHRLGSEATDLDLIAFRAACHNYQDSNDCDDEEAITAIWGNGDFGARVVEWAPTEAKAAGYC